MAKTKDHVRTFALRDDLAEVLSEEIDADTRASTWDSGEAEGQVILDLAESLITRGWVVDYPDDGEGSGE